MSCVPVNLPAAKADDCNPTLNFARVDMVFLGNSGQPMADWTSLIEWTARLDNVDVTDTKIKFLNVIGSKPAPTRNKVEFSKGRSVYTEAEHTLPIKVDETHDDNYLLIKWLEDNAGQEILLWYASGKYLYGGDSGISASLLLDNIIAEDDKALNTFDGQAEWKGVHSDRILNPMA